MRIILLGFFLYSFFFPATGLASFLDEVSLSLEVSDLEYQSINSEFEVESAIEIENKNQETFIYFFKFSFYSEKEVNEFDGSKFTQLKTDYQQRTELKNIFEKFNYTNYIELAQEKSNGMYTTKYNFDFGPLGLKRNFFENDFVTELSLEYMPLYSYRQYYTNDSFLGSDKAIEEVLKHRFNFVFELSFFQSACILSNTVSVQRIEAIDKRKILQTGNEFENDFKATYQILNRLDFAYDFNVNTDEIRVQQGLPRTERNHKVSLSYTWN